MVGVAGCFAVVDAVLVALSYEHVNRMREYWPPRYAYRIVVAFS